MTLGTENDIRQPEAYGQELLAALASKNTAKFAVPHVLALRQIVQLNQTGSQSAAFQLIPLVSQKKPKKQPDNLLHQHDTEKERERRRVSPALSNCWNK